MSRSVLKTLSPRVMETADVEPAGEVEFSSQNRARGLIRGWLLVLDHHGAPKEVMDSFRTQALAYLTVESEATFFARAKYLTCAPMAQYLKCEEPKRPDAIPVWTGRWKSWMDARLHSGKKLKTKNTHLWYSFLQAKRSALPATYDLVLATYIDHRKAMEQEDPITDEVLSLVLKEMEPVLAQIRSRLRSLYDTDSHRTLIDEREVQHAASTRACYERSRAKGGQLGQLLHVAPALERCSPMAKASVRGLPDLKRMVFYPFCVVSGRLMTNVVIEEYEYTDGKRFFLDTMERECLKYIGGASLKCTIQAVLEPLKVRVISKGEAIPYYLSKPLQKAMWGALSELPCFRLIGRPICPTDLLDLAQNRSIVGSGPYKWFSIDYSAATDRLSASLSAAILSFLTEGQTNEVRQMWASVLAPHRCRYPFPYSEEVAPVMQRNGQLMGSILSFPILCLANLGLYLANIAEDSRPLREKLAGVLVNGDDMLYVARESMWKTHVELGKVVGLTMSPGKAYCHPIYANANSECFHLRLDRGYMVDIPRSIPYLNTGLYFGQNKVLGGDDVSEGKSFCSTIEPLLKGCLPGRENKILAGFLKRHQKRIDEELAGRNLFVSTGLGGMGLTPPPNWSYRVTECQRAYALRCLERTPGLPVFGQGPAPGRDIPEVDHLVPHPWIVPQLDIPERDRLRPRRRHLPWSLEDLRLGVRNCYYPSSRVGSSAQCSFDWAKQRSKDLVCEELQEAEDSWEEYLEETDDNIAWLSLFLEA